MSEFVSTIELLSTSFTKTGFVDKSVQATPQEIDREVCESVEESWNAFTMDWESLDIQVKWRSLMEDPYLGMSEPQ